MLRASLLLLFSILLNSYSTTAYAAVEYELQYSNFATRYSKHCESKFNIKCTAESLSHQNDLDSIIYHFDISQPMEIESSRYILMSIEEELRYLIISDTFFRPYFKTYPPTNTCAKIFISYPDNNIDIRYINLVILSHNRISYCIRRDRPPVKDIHEESYFEAYKIYLGSKDGIMLNCDIEDVVEISLESCESHEQSI